MEKQDFYFYFHLFIYLFSGIAEEGYYIRGEIYHVLTDGCNVLLFIHTEVIDKA